MKITKRTHPKVWEWNPELNQSPVLEIDIPNDDFLAQLKHAKRFAHLSAHDTVCMACHIALTHPGHHGSGLPPQSMEKVPVPISEQPQKDNSHFWLNIAIIVILLIIAMTLLVTRGHAEPVEFNMAENTYKFPQIIVNPSQFTFTAGGALIISCPDGTCSGGGGGGGGTSSLFGTTFPASGTAAGFISSTGTMAGGTLDASGNLKAVFSNTSINIGNFPATQPVSGTVTANQGTSPWIVAGGGTAGTPASGVISVQGISGGFAIPVSGTFFQATQPVSCTAATCAINLAQVNGITVLTGAGATGTGSQRETVAQDTTTIAGSAPGTAGTPSSNVVSVQGVASGTAIPVSLASAPTTSVTQGTSPWVVSCTAANCPMNEAQINGVTPLMGNGVTGTGSQRVTIASDNTAFAVNATLSAETTKVIGTVNQGTSPWVTSCTAANCSDNIAQFGGTNVSTGTGAGGTGIPRVTVSNDSTVGLVAGTATIGSVKETDGTNTLIIDPCQGQTKTYTPVNQAAAGPTTIIAGTSAKKTYLCSMFLFTATAQNINLVEGTGTNCSSVTSGILGGTTAATGPNLAANSGFTHGEGNSFVAESATNADNVCLISSSTGQISGGITWVQQ